jgi:hypothetical protein
MSDVKIEPRHWSVRVFESEDGKYSVVEKTPSWAFESTRYVGLATAIRQVRTMSGTQNIPEPMQFPINAMSINEAFEKFRETYEIELQAMNGRQGVIQVATDNVNIIPFPGGAK